MSTQRLGVPYGRRSAGRILGMLTLALGSSGVGPHVVRHIVAAEPSPKIVHRLGKPRLYHTDSTRVGNPHIGGDSPTVQLVHENIPGQLVLVSGNGLRVAHHTEDGVAVISLVPKQGSDRPGTLLQRDLDDEGFRYLSLLSAALSPDGKLLACAPRTGLDVWEVDSGRHLRIAEAERFVKFSHDGSLLAAGGRGNTVLVYDVNSLVACLKP